MAFPPVRRARSAPVPSTPAAGRVAPCPTGRDCVPRCGGPSASEVTRTSGSSAHAGTRGEPRHRERHYPGSTAGVKTRCPAREWLPSRLGRAASDYRGLGAPVGQPWQPRGCRCRRHAGLPTVSGPRQPHGRQGRRGSPEQPWAGNPRRKAAHGTPEGLPRRAESPSGPSRALRADDVSWCSHRSRTPRAGLPGRSHCRRSRSRGRHTPRARRTSPTSPPRWALP